MVVCKETLIKDKNIHSGVVKALRYRERDSNCILHTIKRETLVILLIQNPLIQLISFHGTYQFN